MDWQSVINVGAGALLAVVGFFAKRSVAQQDSAREALHDLRDQIHNVNLRIAAEYLTRQEFRETMREQTKVIETGFERIADKLERKADK